MTENRGKLLAAVPKPPRWEIGWEILEDTPVAPFFRVLSQTPQNPRWHGEGDAWTHTKMVCRELAADEEFRGLSAEKREILFLAALLHDIGKALCTIFEDGTWHSPGHSATGERMARELLWRDFGFSGTVEFREMRECVCALIRNHMLTQHYLDQPEPERKLLRAAAMGELVPGFSMKLLRILVRADLRGRICDDLADSLEAMELCFGETADLGILDKPYSFPNSLTRYAYLSGKNVWREQLLYDSSWGEVILMSGLPGTGKDTWIEASCPDLPMVSLDELRKDLGIAPTDNQGAVVNAARERAKALLREHQPFVWNATNTTAMTRRKQLELIHQYHASARIVFLETGWETGLLRNQSRPDTVPVSAIEKLLKNLEPPAPWEAERVEWLCC